MFAEFHSAAGLYVFARREKQLLHKMRFPVTVVVFTSSGTAVVKVNIVGNVHYLG